MSNKILADIFDEIADMISVDDTPNSKFEVRAYKKAALTIGTLQEPIEQIYANGGKDALMNLPGIGKGLAEKIEQYLKTGKIQRYEELKKKYPIEMGKLTSIQGLGPKTAVELYRSLGVKNIEDLRKALRSHKVAGLPGFGPKSEELLTTGLQLLDSSQGRMLLGDAMPEAEQIVAALLKSGLVDKALIAGSTRRMRETIGDLDILATSKSPEKVSDFFSKMPSVEHVIVKGPTKTTVWLKIGLSCDLRVIDPDSFGAALQYFTGSKDHNVQVRQIAVKKGYKLNEYGLFDKKDGLLSSKDEEEIYGLLGMQWMPPEMREARGEVALAMEHKIPRLVELGDLKGDMHTHTKETDGANTIEEMASAAMGANLQYIAVTNHTKSLPVAYGMDDKKFLAFFKKIDKLNDKLGGKFRILKGGEVDILKDGSLDLEPATLKQMDCVVGSVHSYFKMSEDEMTKRINKALDTGLVTILGHPTGREVNGREPYPVRLEKVAESAERNGVALEIDAFPSRLDLNDTNIMRVSNYKIKFSIDSDAHRSSHFGFLRYGVGTARRGWLTKERVLNSQSLRDITKSIDSRK
jgi:DNA polymerase (family 10)